jgi:ABC-type glycerol-3-phosphate transport system substrate-binding protein
LWLPEELAPDPEETAGEILLEHLRRFELDHPGLEITLRTKSMIGSGAMLEALEAAVSAAPEVAPDLVVLDPGTLMTASLKGMIQPLEGVIPPPIQPQWYGFASLASRVDGVFFGLPLVSEADVFSYRTNAFTSPPLQWNDILSGEEAILLPLSEPSARFTLAQYLAVDGQIVNGSGKPILDSSALAEVLAFLLQATIEGRLSTSSFQFTSSLETWAALLDNSTRAAPALLSAYLKEANPDRHAAIAWPTRDGEGISFTHSWSFAMVTKDSARMVLSGDLLEWLMDPMFLGAWSFALGYLPSTSDALSNWPEGHASALASELVSAGRPLPEREILVILSPVLQDALDAVLRNGTTPELAARSAIESMNSP